MPRSIVAASLLLTALLQGSTAMGTNAPGGPPPASVAIDGPLVAQAGYGHRCATRIGVCSLPTPGPIGHACICMFALGPMPGHIVP
jgi:hypothetical protein